MGFRPNSRSATRAIAFFRRLKAGNVAAASGAPPTYSGGKAWVTRMEHSAAASRSLPSRLVSRAGLHHASGLEGERLVPAGAGKVGILLGELGPQAADEGRRR